MEIYLTFCILYGIQFSILVERGCYYMDIPDAAKLKQMLLDMFEFAPVKTGSLIFFKKGLCSVWGIFLSAKKHVLLA